MREGTSKHTAVTSRTLFSINEQRHLFGAFMICHRHIPNLLFPRMQSLLTWLSNIRNSLGTKTILSRQQKV
jgi:hypothetical protein